MTVPHFPGQTRPRLDRHAVPVSRLLALPVAAAVLIALAGCSGAAAASHATATATHSAAASAKDTRPWASVMMKESAELDQAKAKLADASCTPAATNNFACGMTFTAVGIDMQTIQLIVDSAGNPAAKTYLGSPPPSIASTYSDTKDAAAVAAKAGEAWESSSCVGKASDSCLGKASDLVGAMDALSAQFAAWTPYS